jgi:hypothetical protein
LDNSKYNYTLSRNVGKSIKDRSASTHRGWWANQDQGCLSRLLLHFEKEQMVDGLRLCRAFLSSGHALQYCLTFTHSGTHSHTDGGVSHARRQPLRREQSWWATLSGTPRHSSRGSN